MRFLRGEWDTTAKNHSVDSHYRPWLVISPAKGCLSSVIAFPRAPHGEDDAAAMLEYHIERIHKKDCPKGLPKSEAMKHTKEAK